MPAPRRPLTRLRLFAWTDPAVVGVALVSLAAGFGQFGAVAALGDVARSFGRLTHGTTIAEQAGLSGTELAIGLAIVRLASLGGLPLSGLADRFGRRVVLLTTCAIGLIFTITASGSPGYWWFVAIFALGRPFLSSTAAVAEVNAAEQTSTRDRAKAVALVAAGYGIGSGLTAIIHSLGSHVLGFRGVLAMAVIPLVLLAVVRRWVSEPDRYSVEAARPVHPVPVLGAVEARFRTRLIILAVITFALSVITGPANSLVFIYAENVRSQPGAVTASMVVAAGATGLAGLLAGRWLADRVGRRPTAAVSMGLVALCGILTYSGSRPALFLGYIAGVFAASTFAPAGGALVHELFPTSGRASAVGWQVAAGVLGAIAGLLAFGAIADVGNRFSTAAVITFLPPVAFTLLFWAVPETKGHEPEDLWAE